MTLLDRLDQWKRRYGQHPAPLERLLARLATTRFDDAHSLIRLHETLLFLCAYPPGAESARLAAELLAAFPSRLAGLQTDLSPFEEAEVSGIAGSTVSAVYSYEVARSLALRYGAAIDIDWDWCPDVDRLGPLLSVAVPPAREEWPVEAHPPLRQWVESLKPPNRTALEWLLARLAALPVSDRQRAALYDAASLLLTFRIGNSAASRSLARLADAETFLHTQPLLPRRAVSLESEFALPPIPIERLSLPEARRALDLIVDTSAVRYRQLYGFSHPDLRRVFRARPGRGLDIIWFGVPPASRLPLRAYHAGMYFKNGVPAGYIEVLSFLERAEIGFNLYYTFREGETAWIYAQLLRLCRQTLGVTRFALDPYQIGYENQEGIASGAFWFYRKLGFRSVDPALRKLTAAEERRIAADSAYRTPAHILRKLATRPMIYEPPGATHGEWDSFHIRNLALARWPPSLRRAFAPLRAAKLGPDEARYLRLMQQDPKLRAALLRLGSVDLQEAAHRVVRGIRSSRVEPMRAAEADAARMPSLARERRGPAPNASEATKSDIVKPIPPSQPTP